ncbi:hypothetical protein B0H21DRAFT_689161 [Amylocystis lapponica]|nr:hypothetical protein B0H21DRAFT_689161 [Amylocystis lapponica]
MLPLPISFSARRQYARLSRQHRSTRDVLLTRARVTNLGFLLLAGFAALSFFVNLLLYFSSSENARRYTSPDGILSTLQRDSMAAGLDHLIIVPGHAIWKGTDAAERLNDSEWILEPYQRGGGRVAAFYNHIVAGAELAEEDENTLLVFSGGQTRRISTTTEAESYMRLALASGLISARSMSAATAAPAIRATTENYALDSYQNLLFSVARFHEYTGRWPEQITVVGYEMKRQRFTELHRAALRWPNARFNYIGIDAEGDEAEKAREGEASTSQHHTRQNGYLPYTLDTYGCHGSLLSKRRWRNPFARYHPYYTSSPELSTLLNWCPGTADGGENTIFDGPLPWDHLQ